ncbi:hypothetical protein Tco_1354327, partial [Tanacetum coccineum]
MTGAWNSNWSSYPYGGTWSNSAIVRLSPRNYGRFNKDSEELVVDVVVVDVDDELENESVSRCLYQLHGGYVDCGNDVWRMQGSLGVSRAIGDKHLGRRDTKASAERLDDNNAQATSQVTAVPCVDRCDKPHAKRTHRQTSNEIQKNSRPDPFPPMTIQEHYTDEEQEQTRNHWSTELLLKVNPQNYQEHLGCQIKRETVTTDQHDELIKMGIKPTLKGVKWDQKFLYVIFCAPPSRSSEFRLCCIRKLYHFGMANVLSCLLQAEHHMIAMRAVNVRHHRVGLVLRMGLVETSNIMHVKMGR